MILNPVTLTLETLGWAMKVLCVYDDEPELLRAAPLAIFFAVQIVFVLMGL